MPQFDFTEEEIRNLPQGRLLTMEIEFTRACNYRCPYCYAAAPVELEKELTPEEIRSAVTQARELGARKIVILGGEPLVYPKLDEMIEFISGLGMAVEIFTNGELVTQERAEFFFRHDCRVVVKLNSFREDVHDRMTGRKGSLAIALRTLERLQAAGYGKKPGMLCAATVLSSENLEEAPDLWHFLRTRGIDPYFECITPQGRMNENPGLLPDSGRVKEIFDKLAAIDKQFGHNWKPQPPLAGQACFRHCYSCVVHSTGEVTPCVGLDLVIGSIRRQPLGEILRNSMAIHRLKNYRRYIKSPCRECEKSDHCYGCRGSAWQMTGDYLAADPTCWKNQGKEIIVLPTDAKPYLPHKAPVAMVSEILTVADSGGTVRSDIRPGNVFLAEDGTLDNAALIELAALSVAALHGFLTPGRILPGMLVEAGHFRVSAPVRTGESVVTTFQTDSDFPPWHIISFVIDGISGERKAEGTLKLCVPDE